MLSASSYSLASSKVRRGLVADSWMVSIAMYWNSLLFCTVVSPWVWLRWLRLWSEHGCPVRSRGGRGLGVLCLPLLLEGFCEALRTQVAVPHLGEGNVLLEERTVECVVGAGDEP